MIESRLYGNYTLSFVYGAINDEDRSGIIDLWLRNKALPSRESAEQRVSQVVVIVREGSSGQIIGVNTVYPSKLQVDGPDYYLYRMFIDPMHRSQNMFVFVTRFAYEMLNQRYRKGSPVGLAFFTENPKLQRPGMMAHMRRSGYEYLGRGANGYDYWRKLFVPADLQE